jgi:GYF domain 2
MASRSWFFATDGQQHGPYSEDQFRDLIGKGDIRPDTYVWSEGMAAWQFAGDVPGLLSVGARPPDFAGSGGPGAAVVQAGGPLSVNFGIWDFIWRSVVLLLGLLFVIPAPWVIVMYTRWMVSCTHVPGRPNLAFTGQIGTIVWWYFGAIALAIVIALVGIDPLNVAMFFVQIALYWLFIKWFFGHLGSEDQPLGLGFSGSYWAYLGWSILTFLSLITIIGWAWVYTAYIRWVCRHIQGTRREVIFKGTGLEFLWRAILAGLASLFVIPIPWMYRWIARWLASQTVLVERQRANG